LQQSDASGSHARTDPDADAARNELLLVKEANAVWRGSANAAAATEIPKEEFRIQAPCSEEQIVKAGAQESPRRK
jgi:hypothetical protein